MSHQHGNRTTGNSRPHAVGPAGQNHGHSCAQNHACAVGIREKAQLLGEDVAGFEIRGKQNVRIAGNRGLNAFGLGRLFADGIVKRQRPIQNAALDLSAFSHLAECGRVDRGRHFRGDGFDGGENRDFWFFQAERDRQIDRVLTDINFVFQASERY